MSDGFDLPALSAGCCDETTAQPALYNRPGLAALAYRLGTHPYFLRRMLRRLPVEEIADGAHAGERPLAALTTRASDDPAIAMLDAAAVLLDVLTFYQERVANEGYLRTATERLSVRELARTIGYELNPGVAASAFLAFTVDNATGAPTVAVVPAASKVMSVPVPGEQPQTFETIAEITARVDWNALRPRRTRPQELAIRRVAPEAGAVDTNTNQLVLLGVSVPFAEVVAEPTPEFYPLDIDLAEVMPAIAEAQAVPTEQIYLAGIESGLKPGDILLFVGRRADQPDPITLVRSLGRVVAEPERNRTRVEFEVEIVAQPPAPASPYARKFAYASHDYTAVALTASKVQSTVVNQTWHESELTGFVAMQGWSHNQLVEAVNYKHKVAATPKATATPKGPALSPADPGLFAFRTRLGIFGHNAPVYLTLSKATRDAFYDWDIAGSLVNVWMNSLKQEGAESTYYTAADLYLERAVAGLAGNGWLVLETPINRYAPFRLRSAAESSLAGFAMSARAMGLQLGKPDSAATPLEATDKLSDFKVRTTTAHAQSERLTLAELPIDEPIAAGAVALQLDSMVLGLKIGQPVALTGERADLPGITASEILLLSDIVHAGGHTTLLFAAPGLKYTFVRETLTINANVAPATHGETVHETLGSGNGAQGNQRFVLKKPPLTWVSAAGASGQQSTLEVRVDGLLWQESPRLYGVAPDATAYVARMDEEGRTSVTFGDGEFGARLPTGVENVTAVYRSGIGAVGMVGADKLTLLQTRPLGIRSVTNPVAASGAADPEERDSARANAPRTVLTLERVVSLRDFEAFARAFAGIGKAHAQALWRGEEQWVHVTVASEAPHADSFAGSDSPLASHVVDAGSDLYINLVKAMGDAGDPSLRFRVDTYQPVFFALTAKLLCDPRYRWQDVKAAATAALIDAFGFAARDFAQPVTSAEVIATLQGVAGVVAVDLDALRRIDQPETPAGALLEATQVKWPAGSALPELAELLLISPAGIALEEMQP